MSNIRKNIIRTALPLVITCALAFTFSAPAQADGAGAFLGGIAVAKMGKVCVTGMITKKTRLTMHSNRLRLRNNRPTRGRQPRISSRNWMAC